MVQFYGLISLQNNEKGIKNLIRKIGAEFCFGPDGVDGEIFSDFFFFLFSQFSNCQANFGWIRTKTVWCVYPCSKIFNVETWGCFLAVVIRIFIRQYLSGVKSWSIFMMSRRRECFNHLIPFRYRYTTIFSFPGIICSLRREMHRVSVTNFSPN